MQPPLGTYTSNRSIGRVKISKPISRGAAIIGLLLFLLGVALLVSGTLLHTKNVNDDIDDSDPKLYGLWSAPGPLIVSVFGIIVWWTRRKGMIIAFAVANSLNVVLCVVQAVFVLPVTFWFKDFLTLSKCRDGDLEHHGLEYDADGTSTDSDKRSCGEMNTIAKLFILLAIACIFSIVISIGGVIDGILGVIKMRKDKVEQMDGITNEEFQQMEQKTAMWLQNNVRFSTGSTIARSERSVSVDQLSTDTGYKDKSWV